MSGESEYVADTVYRVTVGHWTGLAFQDPGDDDHWRLIGNPDAFYTKADAVSDIAPLRILGPDERVVEPGQVVLDIPSEEVGHIVRILRKNGGTSGGDVADQIEAQTKPPRIPEPGLYGVVEDAYGIVYVRQGMGPRSWFRVASPDSDGYSAWSEIHDPVLVREGVES